MYRGLAETIDAFARGTERSTRPEDRKLVGEYLSALAPILAAAALGRDIRDQLPSIDRLFGHTWLLDDEPFREAFAKWEIFKSEHTVASPASGKPVIFVDVDDTLVRSFGSKRIPITAVIERVRDLHRAGFRLYCWSTGGAEYCQATVAELGIAECFIGLLPKPRFMIDDQHPSEWRGLRWLHTNEAASMTPDDYLKDAAAG